MNITSFLSKVAEEVTPYTWEKGVNDSSLRFDTNTLPLPPKSLNAFLPSMQKNCPINEYADPTYTDLKKILAKYESIQIDQLTITNSGDEAIDILAKTFLNSGERFIVTPPTYEMFSIQCRINKGISLEIPLEKNTWEVNANAIIQASANPKVKLIFLCNPNNPTASVIDPQIIEKIVKESNAIVVIDETYREFYGKSSNFLINKYSNVVILRSFSKFAGMAGARVGYLIASKELSQKFDSIRFPMGVSFFSYKLAESVLRNDRNWILNQVKMVIQERNKVKNALKKLGFTVYPSKTNFLLVNMGKKSKEIYEMLKEQNIYIRDRSSKKNLEDCMRITVRSSKENNVLILEIKKILAKLKTQKYAFIDRDGTLIFEPQDTFQIDSIKKFRILDGVIKGLQELMKNGYALVMVSNQDGLGTKSYPKESFDLVQKNLLQILRKNGIVFENIFICPHVEKDNCDCRKPKTKLIQKYIEIMNTDKSFIIGDRDSDKELAKNIGVKFVAMKTNSNFYEAIKKGVKA